MLFNFILASYIFSLSGSVLLAVRKFPSVWMNSVCFVVFKWTVYKPLKLRIRSNPNRGVTFSICVTITTWSTLFCQNVIQHVFNLTCALTSPSQQNFPQTSLLNRRFVLGSVCQIPQRYHHYSQLEYCWVPTLLRWGHVKRLPQIDTLLQNDNRKPPYEVTQVKMV